jgi:hypothetical protein
MNVKNKEEAIKLLNTELKNAQALVDNRIVSFTNFREKLRKFSFS